MIILSISLITAQKIIWFSDSQKYFVESENHFEEYDTRKLELSTLLFHLEHHHNLRHQQSLQELHCCHRNPMLD